MNMGHGRLNRRGQIDVIEMSMYSMSCYKYLFVYEDQLSKFVVLKALHDNTVKEVARKLFDILAIIGPPQVLQSGNGRVFAKQIVCELRILWEDAIILHGDIFKQEESKRDFKSLLKNWIKENPTKMWYEGLNFLQIVQNTTYRCPNGKIPTDMLFGEKFSEEFQASTVSNDIGNDMWTEEQWICTVLDKKGTNNSGTQGSACTYEETQNVALDNVNHSPHYDRDTRRNSQVNSNELLKDSKDANAFNFVNVMSDIPSFSLQQDDIFLEEKTNQELMTVDEQTLKCKVCRKQYMKHGHLKNHMKTHTQVVRFDCKMCNKTFRVLTLFKKHMRQCHNTFDNEKVSCRKGSKKLTKCISPNALDKETPEGRESMDALVVRSRLTKKHGTSSNTTENSEKSMKNSRNLSRRKNSGIVGNTKANGYLPLKCTYCNQHFNFPSVLKRHIRSHTNERPYICEICNKSFKQLGHLSQHSLTHKDLRSFQCTVCSVKFTSLDSLKQHSQTHKGEVVSRSRENYRLFECDNCKKIFTTKSVLERHIFTHIHERLFGCKVCGKRFKQAGHVKSHMLIHTGERKFQCTICLKRFSLSNSLKKHMYVHNGEKPYQCDICGTRFLEKRNLNGHLLTHTNERPFSCKICGKRYTLADTLRRHISAAHEDGRTYQCEICAKMFKQLAHLSVHKKVHNDERPFQCHLCEKNFKHKNVLKSHLAIHANVRPFECDDCKATFVRKTNLQTHIASAHMNERPYVCTICGKRFKQISHLNGHVVVHSNSMPYQCDYCDRRCNRLDNLKKHMRLHTKNKD